MKYFAVLVLLFGVAVKVSADEAGVTLPNNGNPISVKSDGQGGFIASKPDGDTVHFQATGGGFQVTDANGNPIANIQANGAGGFELKDKDGHVYETEKEGDAGYQVKDSKGNPITQVRPDNITPAGAEPAHESGRSDP